MRPAAGLFVALTLTCGGAHTEAACDPDTATARDVRAIAAGIVAADNAKDVEQVLRYYATDAVLLPPGEQPVVGREAIRPRYETLFARFDPKIETKIEEACVDGNLAVVRGRNGGRLNSRGRAPTRELDDAFLMVLRRDERGEWRISHLMWQTASPPGVK